MSIVRNIAIWWQSFIQSIYAVFFSASTKFEGSDLTVYYNATDQFIGEGAFSVVLKASKAFSNTPEYALKRMLLQSKELEQIAQIEIESFQRFQHKNILHLIDSKKSNESGHTVVYLLFPYMERGTLRDELNRVMNGTSRRSSLRSTESSFIAICESKRPPYAQAELCPPRYQA